MLVYSEAVSRGGAEVSLRNLLAALAEDVDVAVMGVDAGIVSWIAAARPGTGTVVVPDVPTKAAVGALAALRRVIAAQHADVFHANLRTMGDAQYALLAALSVPGLRVLAVEQLPLPPPTRLSARLKSVTSRRLAAHVAVGRRAARQVEAAVGLPTGSVRTIHNGVPDVALPPRRPAGDRTVIGTLARLDRIKGLDVLLDAAGGLTGAEVLLVGEGPEREALRAQADRLRTGAWVEFTPWSDDARRHLSHMDVFVLPSHAEGFPLSIVEAMLAGLPVVASDVGSVAEAVAHGATGLLVPAGDVDALRAALAALAGDPERRERMGRAGRTLALESFTAATMARAFEALYAEATARRRTSGRRRAARR